MAQIKINNNLTVEGSFTMNKTLIEKEDGKLGFAINGVLSTHLYFEDITNIETERYKVEGINVYQERYGSDDYNIIYEFSAENIEVKGVDCEGARFILYPSEMEEIEKIMYKDELPIVGNIGKEYSKIKIKEDKENIEEDEE